MSSSQATQNHNSASRSRPNSILDVYSLLLAVFLFASPWLFAYGNGTARIDLWVGGALVAITSVAAIVAFSEWEEWLNLLLGIWLVAAPWILAFAHTRAMHLSVGVGVVVVYLAGLELWLMHYGYTASQPGAEKKNDNA